MNTVVVNDPRIDVTSELSQVISHTNHHPLRSLWIVIFN